MKAEIAQLFLWLVTAGAVVCLAGIALCGLYAMGALAWDLWGRHLLPSRPRRVKAAAPRLVDAEAEGWLDELEWGFPGRRTVEAQAGDQTGELELPRVGVAV